MVDTSSGRERRIHLLEMDVVNKIAAGEVIERPYSVIKELVENAIDAMATRITINIEEGGKNLIEIIDNGHGIPHNDVRLAFQRHATSKISNFEDLETLRSMGFRGEALPSIASVAVVEIQTRHFQEEVGTFFRIEGGRETAFIEQARDFGTTLRVKNLFFNVPARKKFLRQNSTELRYIIAEVTQQALALPHIAFRLSHDDRELFHYTPVKDHIKRIHQVFGDEMENQLMPVELVVSNSKLTGFAGSPALARKNSQIYLFINTRYVRDKLVTKAILEVYRSMLEKNNYPFVVLYLEIDPALVDFNVHPSKREIKFDDRFPAYRIFTDALQQALNSGYSKDNSLKMIMRQSPMIPSKATISYQDVLPLQTITHTAGKADMTPDIQKVIQRLDSNIQHEQNTSEVMPHLWQLQLTYIVTNTRDGMVIIDQHAAGERILYEKILKNFREQKKLSQSLLFPEVVELTSAEMILYRQTDNILVNMGFMIKEFSGNSLVIEGIPAYLHHWESASTLKDILDDLAAEKEPHIKAVEKIARYTACRAAVKAGDRLTVNLMQQLIDDLFICEFPYTCPHGRPTLIKITFSELEKRLGRK